MCGIAGIAPLSGRAVPERAPLERMVSAIRHRGPDGRGYYLSPGIGLGHARLSIIDVDGGKQPIHNEDQTVWVSYNGEIFNYKELRADLLHRGHRFYTETDTEVIVHLYEEYGDNFVDHLNGQFAISLWDESKRRLILVRDRVGILPLFYTVKDGQLLFCSEVKGMLKSGLLDARLSPAALDEVFTFWCPVAPRTLFEGVHQLRPGEMLVLQNGEVHQRQYWNWSYPADGEFHKASEADLTAELRSLLDDATRIRLRADVPVGAYLSGGLDSSSLVAMIKQQNVTDLRTFSIGFESKQLDESAHQNEMSAFLQTDHSSVTCRQGDIAERFVQSLWHAEVPVLRTAPVPMGMLSGLVRENDFKVVLTGEGADEVLGGYDIFKEAKVREFWARNPDSSWRPALLKRLYPYLDFGNTQNESYLKAFFGGSFDQIDTLAFSHIPRWNMTSQIKMFYSNDFRDSVVEDVRETFAATPAPWREWQRFNRWEFVEASTILPGYILSSQGDRMLMSNSVEGRFPFLDHRVIEFAEKLPPKLKMRAMREKYLLKQAMRDDLPESIVRRSKQPYRAPNVEAFVAEAASSGMLDFLHSDAVSRAGYFDSRKVDRLLNKARRSSGLGERDNMAFVGILSTQVWHHLFVDGAGSQFSENTPKCDALNLNPQEGNQHGFRAAKES
ncbi:asparagine synthase (glutamine-hydrolyzing) [Woeseia oceani]|uniref:asparagine synthase (glutamine-hydrolyzing) n=1 Tax=Woeseia oceani TaxID=1548547 RepID=A0A193LEJ5_9GAMM|nr:asparagine synthase (glutamine-hydrolyzing) [Woeseia oceani]ANO50950.1 asparagine synthase (glutamine-hydrolyzing) [Woeseia oceani]